MTTHDQLISEHADLRRALSELQQALDKNSSKLQTLFSSFQERLRAHIQKEDGVYYRLVDDGKVVSDRDMMHTLRNDHAAMVFTLESLAIRLRKGSPMDDWKKRFKELVNVLLGHFEREERGLFPEVERVLSPEQKASLWEAMQNAQ